MNSIDGSWQCRVETPVGPRTFHAELTPHEDRFEARVTGNFGEMEIEDGRLNGDVMTWTMAVTSPLPLNLTCTALVSGDRMAGSVSAGIFGKYPLTGTRL